MLLEDGLVAVVGDGVEVKVDDVALVEAELGGALEEGGLPKQTTKKTLRDLSQELKNDVNPLKVLAILQKNIANELRYSEVLPLVQTKIGLS